MKKLSFVVMDLSGIYERESFWREREGALLLSLRDRFQRGGLRAPEEEALLRAELLRPELLGAPLHFLDLSDYHYMSRFWLEQREEDFLLVIYDYDADLRRTEQKGISHASWIREIMLRMPHCRGILLLGPSAEKRARINDELMSLGREYRPSPELRDPILSTSLYCFTDEDLRNGRAESHIPSLLQLLSLPLCLSIDKRLFQGEGREGSGIGLEEYARSLSWILASALPILSVDLCGEPEPGAPEELVLRENERNRKFVDDWAKFFGR